jgi:hypothetical protein
MSDIQLLRFSLVSQQVCAPASATEAEIVQFVRENVPLGLSGGIDGPNAWRMSEHEDNAPVQCADDPERTHYVLCCGGFDRANA